jgi:hypothetical protein
MPIPQRSDTSPKSGERKYGKNADFADPVNKKYPLDTKAHIRNAASRIGAEKNASKYPSSAVSEIKGRIHAAEKREGIGQPGAKLGEALKSAFGGRK